MSDIIDGYGYGDGDGDGSGYGYGYGYGYGDAIGTVGKHAVTWLRPWGYILIGCQCRSIDWWRDNWQSVARKEKVRVSQSQVEEMLCKVTSYVAEQTDGQ